MNKQIDSSALGTLVIMPNPWDINQETNQYSNQPMSESTTDFWIITVLVLLSGWLNYKTAATSTTTSSYAATTATASNNNDYNSDNHDSRQPQHEECQQAWLIDHLTVAISAVPVVSQVMFTNLASWRVYAITWL